MSRSDKVVMEFEIDLSRLLVIFEQCASEFCTCEISIVNKIIILCFFIVEELLNCPSKVLYCEML
jgi:hypothetical protein